MSDAATYSARETLRDGRRLEIRALKPDDRADLEAAVGRVSDQSLYRRFFEIKRHFSEQEIAFFLNVDFVNHVALVAVVEEGARPGSWAAPVTSSLSLDWRRWLSPSSTNTKAEGSARRSCATSPRSHVEPGSRR